MGRWKAIGLDVELGKFTKAAAACPDACKKAVEAGAYLLVNTLKDAAPVLKEPRAGVTEGALRDSIKASKPKADSSGAVYSEVKPEGTDHGQDLAKIGNILEYGRSNMAAQPWFHKTIKAADPDVKDVVRTVFELEIAKSQKGG